MLDNPRFEESYERLFGSDISLNDSADRFFIEFYKRFLTSPEIEALFADTDIDRQVKMVKVSFFRMISFYVTGQVSSDLEHIADLHQKLRIQPATFDLWLEALLETVRSLDPQADDATILAWAWALTPGITYMRLRLV